MIFILIRMLLGEFGPIYEREEFNPYWTVHNDERYKMLDKQLAIYSSESIGKLSRRTSRISPPFAVTY